MVKVGINGFGRIGRLILRALLENYKGKIQVVGINDLGSIETNAHLIKYDSTHGILNHDVKTTGDGFQIGDQNIKVFAERDPAKLPWGKVGADVVLECTGFFLDKIYDILSEEGYLIISGPKEPAEVFVEGQISTCILPVLIQNLIYAGFDCKKGKMMSLNLVENSFIVKKDKNFRLKERTETGYEWSKEHNNRSPIELKMGNTVSSSGLFLFNCEIWKIVIEKDKSGQYKKTIGLSFNLPKNYNPKEVNLNLNIPSNIRIFDQKLTELQSMNHITI